MRENIEKGTFPQFVQKFVSEYFAHENYPSWVVNSLSSVGINVVNKYFNCFIVSFCVLKPAKSVHLCRRSKSYYEYKIILKHVSGFTLLAFYSTSFYLIMNTLLSLRGKKMHFYYIRT